MIFPIGDDNVIGGCKPIFSYAFIFINVAIFFLQISVQGNLVCEFATIPQDIIHGKNYYTIITSMFLHGGWMHLLGNMLFLWIFADNIEATIGHIPFLLFYIAGGIFAALVHVYFEAQSGGALSAACCKVCEVPDCENPCAGYIPSLGASGAISAVMGAYLVMFPKSKIKMIFIIFFKTFTIPAFLFLLFWFGQQLFSGVGSLGPASAGAGVAWWAHIGGFVFGLVLGFLFKGKVKVKPAYHTKDYV